MFRDDLLKDHTILVSGGGTGLGRAIAEKYASLGAHVWICGRRESVLAETARSLNAGKPRPVSVRAVDIRRPSDVEAMVEEIFAQGPLTGLVNNAAANFLSQTETVSAKGFAAIADTVFSGTFHLTNAVGRRWIAGGLPGSIVSILTTWIWTGSPFAVPATMSKAGVDAMTRSLAIEWGRHGIRANAIAPGVIPTKGMSNRLDPGDDPERRGRQNPMGRVGRLSELQNLATFLMADGCEWLTGATIALDGAGHLANGTQLTELFSLTPGDWQERRSRVRAFETQEKAAGH